jgi:hypothetical protein
MGTFDAKAFNAEAFKYAVERIPNLKLNEIKKSNALTGNPDIKAAFSNQDGTGYATIAMRGLADGDAVNYDGNTDITATSTKTFTQGVVVTGRGKAWVERDFSYDITGGVDFMDNIAKQIAEYKDGIDQKSILSVLKGVFSMTGAKNQEFTDNHTTTLTTAMTATTLNSACNKACGANKKKFTLVFMHSDVATGLENLNLIDRLKYTDADGIQRDLELGTWNGKLVVVDDELPTEDALTTAGVYSLKIDTAAVATDKITIFDTEYTFIANDATPGTNEIKVGASGTAAQQASNLNTALAAKTGVEANFTYSASSDTITITQKNNSARCNPPTVATASGSTIAVTLATTTPAVYSTDYTTYVLGNGALSYEDVGVKQPYEMGRNPATNGGQDTLYIRQRKCFSPYGISYTKASQATLSPTDTELETGANWSLVHSGEASESSRSYINHKAIPIARIISRG